MTSSKLLSRPVEQTPAWTFAAALSVLSPFSDPSLSDAVDEFLLYNNDVLLQPMPFMAEKAQGAIKEPQAKTAKAEGSDNLRHFQLRGVLYEGASDANIAWAHKVAASLSVDVKEVLRVVLQTKKRVPEDSGAVRPETAFLAAFLAERRTVLEIAARCFANRFSDASLVARNVGKSYLVNGDYVAQLVEGLHHCHAWLTAAPTGLSAEETGLARDETLLLMEALLRFLHELLVESDSYAPAMVQRWFGFAGAVAFGAAYMQDQFSVVSSLCAVISLKLLALRPDAAVPPYFGDAAVFASLVEVVAAGSSRVVKYGLLLALYKKSLLLAESPDAAATFASAGLSQHAIQDHLAALQAELDASVFADVQHLAAYLARFDDCYCVALVELIVAALPMVTATDELVSCISAVLQEAPHRSVDAFFDSPDAQQLFVLARAKFPMLMGPFLKLAAINSDFALHELEELRSYMQSFDAAQFAALHEIDADNTSLVRLSQPVDVYPQYETSKKLSLLLKADTKAQVFHPDDPHKVWVTFLYKYNGWAFLGRVLENISRSFDASNLDKMALLSTILDLVRQVSRFSDASIALEYMSAYTDDADVLDVLFRLLEQCLHRRLAELSGTLLDILAGLMPLIIGRIWSYLSTSSLFSHQGKEGFVSIIFGSIEMVRGDYSFTQRLAEFALTFCQNCLSSADEYPASSKAEIIAQLTDHLLQVFSASCNYNDGYQKLRLETQILDVFRECLVAVYCIAPDTKPAQKPTAIFAPAADRILDAFLSHGSDSARPLFSSIDMLASVSCSHLLVDPSGYFGAVWSRTCLTFSKLVTQIRSQSGRPPSDFERRLFRHLPQLVMIYAKGGGIRGEVLNLLSALANAKWPVTPENSMSEPSMLSHLGRSHSRVFLHSLAADLESPFDDQAIKISIYEFLCALMEANQQGLSVFFISGRDVFGEVSAPGEAAPKSVSLLSILKRNINDINYLPPQETVHLLDAVALAFSSWTIARNDESDDVFVQELIQMMAGFQKSKKGPETAVEKPDNLRLSNQLGELYSEAYHCKLYAKVAETLSLLLFATKNEKCKTAIVDYLRGDSFFAGIADFFSISNYQTSLFDDVNEQFAALFPKYQLSDFAVSFKDRNHFDTEQVYNLQAPDAMFEKHPNWDDLRGRILLCEANIQYYNAQTALEKSMAGLVTTFCRRAPQAIPPSYPKLALQLLTITEPRDAYTQDTSRQLMFGKIELAFLLLYTAYCQGTQFAADAIAVVDASLALMGDSNVGYLNFGSDRTDYSYRSLLRILYVSLSQIGSHFDLIALNHQVLMKVFDFVVSRGTQGLIVQLENNVYLSRKNEKKGDQDGFVGEALSDFELILSILKLFTQMKLSRALQSEIMASLRKHKTVEAICSLHSFAHLVVVGNNEPVLAQLSLMYIQHFLTMDEFCDNLGEYNVFTVMRESIISRPFKDGGVSVENNMQLHRNWINGVLPILVTCLRKNTELQQVILTMRAFQKQIEFCAESWTKDSASLQISTAGTFETMQILYIFKILHEITSARGMAVESDTDVDMSILPGFDTQQKRAHFGDFVNNLLKHPKFLASRIWPSSKEEELVLSRNDEKYQTFVKSLIDDISELKILVS